MSRVLTSLPLFVVSESAMCWIPRFFWDEQGTTAVEYAVMLALILVAIIGAISSVGASSGGLWGDTQTKIDTALHGS